MHGSMHGSMRDSRGVKSRPSGVGHNGRCGAHYMRGRDEYSMMTMIMIMMTMVMIMMTMMMMV